MCPNGGRGSDLVDEVLDRERHEAVEHGCAQICDLFAGDVSGVVGRQRRVGRSVSPANVHMHVERAVPALGKSRVFVPGEIGKRGPRHLHQLQARPAASEVRHGHAAVGRPVELKKRRRSVAVLTLEQDGARFKAAAIRRRHERRFERDLLADDAQALHVRVRFEEPAADEVEPLLQRRPGECR